MIDYGHAYEVYSVLLEHRSVSNLRIFGRDRMGDLMTAHSQLARAAECLSSSTTIWNLLELAWMDVGAAADDQLLLQSRR
jgi:hypothetical protein